MKPEEERTSPAKVVEGRVERREARARHLAREDGSLISAVWWMCTRGDWVGAQEETLIVLESQ